MNNLILPIKTKYYSKKVDRRSYSHNYYQKNKEKKKNYYDTYYQQNKEYIRQYAEARRPKIPREYNKIYQETTISFK